MAAGVAVSFRREAYVPRGGPNGGNGGKGSRCHCPVADKQLGTLIDLKYQQNYFAKNGEEGRGKEQSGADAAEYHHPRSRRHHCARCRDQGRDRRPEQRRHGIYPCQGRTGRQRERFLQDRHEPGAATCAARRAGRRRHSFFSN